MSLDAKASKQLEQFVEEASTMRLMLEMCCEKIANIELRQSHASGECNDSIRAMQQWAGGESATLPERAVKTVADMIKARGKATYYEVFVLKDLRRGELELYNFPEGHRQERVRADRQPVLDGRVLHEDAVHPRRRRDDPREQK